MKRKLPRIKKKVIATVIIVILFLLIGAAWFLHLMPAGLTHTFDQKATAKSAPLLGTAAAPLALPLYAPLVADLSVSPQDLYTPLTIQFLDLSRGEPASWHWDFGDGTSSSQQDPVHVYATSGIWNATMTVTRTDGAQKTATLYDVLYEQKNSTHSVLLDTYRQGVLAKGSSIVLVTATDDAFVSFNNARIPVPNGSVVKLRTNSDGAGTIMMRYGKILRFESPDASLFINGSMAASGASGDCYLAGFRYAHANLTFSIVPTKGEIRQFQVDGVAVRSGSENSHMVFTWDSSDLRNDMTLISYPAYYEGSVTSYDLSPALIADFVDGPPYVGSVPMNVSFRDQSAGNPTSWHWDFGDGSVSSDQNPVHQYVTDGSYTVMLNVSNGKQVDSKVVQNAITVSPPDIMADFNATPRLGTAPLKVKFMDNSTGSPTSWSWGVGGTGSYTIGDGQIYNATQQNTTVDIEGRSPVITFLDPGMYSIWEISGNIYGTNEVEKTGYITVTNPYLFPTQDIFAKTGKQGFIVKDSSIRFTVGNTPATIGMNGGFRDLPKGSLITIVAESNQSGDIFIDSGKLLKFSFPDMALYVNGEYVQSGQIDSIYVPYMTNFETDLTYYLPPESARTQIAIDGATVLNDLDNAWIQIDGLGMNEKGSLSLVSTPNSTDIDGAANQTVQDWIII